MKLLFIFTLQFHNVYTLTGYEKLERVLSTTNKHLFKCSHNHHESCDGINAWGMRKKVDVCEKGLPKKGDGE